MHSDYYLPLPSSTSLPLSSSIFPENLSSISVTVLFPDARALTRALFVTTGLELTRWNLVSSPMCTQMKAMTAPHLWLSAASSSPIRAMSPSPNHGWLLAWPILCWPRASNHSCVIWWLQWPCLARKMVSHGSLPSLPALTRFSLSSSEIFPKPLRAGIKNLFRAKHPVITS